ncbi:RidA family protein [Nocardia yamanashiensis]|uniref:RidA family protein n=1 Tax=Nocardia yamanashiensis TaxID=209247 RepID=UPI001E47446C|nr:RidA family protein [Nocardia yamanashiensis]UGT44818.1 RidA family protein [Nocardia yamanashiensis]
MQNPPGPGPRRRVPAIGIRCHGARGHPARGELVFIAGQYDSDAIGHITTTDFAGQVERAFHNLGVALRSVGLDFADVAQLRTHIVDHDLDKLSVLGRRIALLWGDRPPAQTLTGVAALALPGMQFEVDAIAVRR